MTEPITYVFLAYGDSPECHKQTLASVCSLKSVKHLRNDYRTVIYTDKPAYYKWLQLDAIESVNTTLLAEWMGPSGFGFRIKPCLIADLAKKHSGPIIYLDGDTIAINDLSELEEYIMSGTNTCVMHKKEYRVGDRKSKERREYMQKLSGVDLGSGVMLQEDSWMWNAGVIGLGKNFIHAAETVLPIIDKMIALKLSDRTRLKEQLAFSLYLQKNARLFEARDSILHYWGNKSEWNNLIDKWLLAITGKQMTAEQAGAILQSMQPFPAEIGPKRSKKEKRKARLRKLLGLD